MTTIRGKYWYEESPKDIADTMRKRTPTFGESSSRFAFSFVNQIQEMIDHDLWHYVKCKDFNEYCTLILEKKPEWVHALMDLYKEKYEGDRVVYLYELESELSKSMEVNHRALGVQITQEVFPEITQDEIANLFGVDQATISRDLCRNPVQTEKVHTKRKKIQLTLNSGTKPETAAAKIRAKFGDTFINNIGLQIMTDPTFNFEDYLDALPPDIEPEQMAKGLRRLFGDAFVNDLMEALKPDTTFL